MRIISILLCFALLMCPIESGNRQVLMENSTNNLQQIRTPFSYFTIPKFKVNLNKILNQTIGKLTLLGEYECYMLGDAIRKRYLEKSSPFYIHGIDPIYQSHDYQLISTSFDRTLRSGQSFSMGLFPPKHGYKMDVSPYGYPLPGGVQSVPYHSTDLVYDKMLLGFDPIRCPKLVTNRNIFFQSSDGKKVISDYHEIMSRVLYGTGLNQTNPVPDHANFIDVYYIWDYVLSLKQHDLLPDFFIKEGYFNDTKKVSDASYYYQFKKSIVGNLGGGLFLGEVLSNMNTFLSGVKKEKEKKEERRRSSSSSSSRSRDEVRSNDNWDSSDGSNPSFIHYSAHDQTIAVVLSNLGLIDAEESLRQEVQYGATLIFELWGDDEYGNLGVEIVYKHGWNGEFQSYKLPLPGDGGEKCVSSTCDFELFNRILNKECVITEDEYCSLCGVDNSTGDNVCLKTNYNILKSMYGKEDKDLGKYKNWLMVVSILCVIFFVCCICMCVPGCLACVTQEIKCRKKKSDSTKGEFVSDNMSKKRHGFTSAEEEELLSDIPEDDYLIHESKTPLVSSGDPGHQEKGGISTDEDDGENHNSINYESTDYI